MKLIYRAQTYEYTPHSYVPSTRKPCALNSTVKDGAVKLIYQAQAYEYTPPPIQLTVNHRPYTGASKWRSTGSGNPINPLKRKLLTLLKSWFVD